MFLINRCALLMAVLGLILLLGIQLGAQALYSSPALTVAACSGGYRIITVNATSSCEEAGSCLSSNGSVPCCTLEYVLRMGIPTCSRVVVDSDNETLHQATVVNGSHDFILQGNGPGTGKMSTVYCTSDVNLTFTNCQNVLLSGMQFQACALSFMNCDNVTITNTFTALAEPSLKALVFPCKDEVKDEDEDECELNYYYDPLKQKRTYFASDNVCYYRNTTCVQEGYWFGTLPSNNTHMIYGAFPCPFGFCDFSGHCSGENCSHKSFFCEIFEPNALCYGNRGGVLCSQCAQNYSFTFDAVDCAPSEDCRLVYIFVMIGLVLAFWALLVTVLLVVVYLDLRIGSGRLYSFIFFFSVLQFFVGGSFPSKFLFVIELVVTGFIQLDPKMFGLIPICIPGDPLHSMEYAFLRYIHPLFLAVVIVLLICISKRRALPLFHHNQRATNAICILLYLSFFSLTQTSLSFLVPVRFQNSTTMYASLDPTVMYFTSNHLWMAILALFTQVVLVVPFLCLLVLSPLLVRWFNLLRLKPVLDEFQACYQDRYRSFAGFYLTWRLVIFLLSSVGDYFVNIYLLQVMAIILLMVHAMFQPYREQWLNVLDTLFITDLILLSILHGSTANVVFESPGLTMFKDIVVHLLVLLPLVYFVSLCLWPILKRVFDFLFNRKGKKRMLRNVGGDTDTAERDIAGREPLLFQQSFHSSELNIPRGTDRKNCDVPRPRLPTTSIVGLSQSATS